METLQILMNYMARIAPGLILIAAVLILMRPNKHFRIVIYIFTFVLMRDAMTPLGLWRLGKENGALWLRMSDDPYFLLVFAGCSLLMMLGLYFLDGENSRHIVWFQSSKIKGLLFGVLGCIIVVAPFLYFYNGVAIADRGGAVSRGLLAPLLVFTMLGNFLEEGLFRGYVLGYLRQREGSLIAGIYSGVLFAFCHVFLATTVTDIGMSMLIFTLWEGSIAGLVGSKYGVIPATITHGGAIFLLSSGLI